MRNNIAHWFARKKWIPAAAGVPVLVAAWWAFRPEKLWINERVNEPAPFSSVADPQPLYTGRLQGNGQPLAGRATVYKTASGLEYLRLTSFRRSSGTGLRVALLRSGGAKPDQRIDLGVLSIQSDQQFDLPDSVDLGQYHTIAIYSERPNRLFGLVQLEPF